MDTAVSKTDQNPCSPVAHILTEGSGSNNVVAEVISESGECCKDNETVTGDVLVTFRR